MVSTCNVAFALVPVSSLPPKHAFALCPRWRPSSFTNQYRRFHDSLRACLPSTSDSSGTDETTLKSFSAKEPTGPKLSKTEEIAQLLGQSKSSMAESARKVRQADELSKRQKAGYVLLSTVLATTAFLSEKYDPTAGGNIMKYLQEQSPPPSIIGSNSNPTLIEFGAEWCKNCKSMAKTMLFLEKEYMGRVNFVVVDGDDVMNSEIIEQYSVDGIPQFSFLDSHGTVIANFVGRLPKDVIAQELDALIAGKPMPFPGLALDNVFPQDKL